MKKDDAQSGNGGRLIALGLIVLVFLTGCSAFRLLPPRIVNHPPPVLRVSMDAFSQAGCTATSSGLWACPDDSPLAALGCEELEQPSDLYGALDPAYPVALCRATPRELDGETFVSQMEAIKLEGYLYSDGCMMPAFMRLVTWRDGEFQLLKTPQDIQAAFAPISSAEEALSYVLAVTGYSAYYGQQWAPGYRYLSGTVEDSFVRETEAGFVVHVFDYQLCGCGPHETASIDVQVSREGHITQGDYVPMYADPAEDGLCVD